MTMPTIKPDWAMPPKPVQECPHCTSNVIAEAYIINRRTDDFNLGWRLLWACSDCPAEFGEIEWPFGDDDLAQENDLIPLGFEITEWCEA